ncbi:recombinase family protein [Sulfurovum sp.]|uniref:recombinase family protein n=1 Tax=Sulfurovum sp. TaxID=1969726 RepID=UPI0025E03107|nr:recombinase family protein [Sulfurovum sp.]
MTYAYLRQMPDNTNLSDQQRNILSFSLTQGISIDKEVIEYSTKNHSIEERKQFEEFFHSLGEGDMLVVDTLSVLSDKAEEMIKLFNCMLSRNIKLYISSLQIYVSKETPIVKVFPLLNDLCEAQKARSNQIGRPKGSRSSSKFDVYQAQIVSLLREGMNVSAISRELGVSRSSLKDYIESRGIRELVEGSWMEISPLKEVPGVDNTVLICPFDEERETQKEQQLERIS